MGWLGRLSNLSSLDTSLSLTVSPRAFDAIAQGRCAIVQVPPPTPVSCLCHSSIYCAMFDHVLEIAGRQLRRISAY